MLRSDTVCIIASTILCLFIFLFAVPDAFGIMQRLTPDVLAQRAGTILTGDVINTYPYIELISGEINTEVLVEVREVIKGESPEIVRITVPGGIVGYRGMFVTDHPWFETGQRALLFLDESGSRINGQIQGKFTISRGEIEETGQNAEDFIQSLGNLVSSDEPLVDFDVPFYPVSVEIGLDRYFRNLKFGYNGIHWDRHNVKIRVNENMSDGEGELAAIRAGMSEWNNAPADFEFIYDGQSNATSEDDNGINEAGWANISVDAIAYVQCWLYDDGILFECDLVFSNAFKWSAKGDPNDAVMDVQNIATHELGHFLLLEDLYSDDDYKKTMYGFAMYGETLKRSLHQDDIDGIVHIYGEGASTGDDDDDNGNQDDDDSSDIERDEPEFDTADCPQIVDEIYGDCDFDVKIEGDTVLKNDALASCNDSANAFKCANLCVFNSNVNDCESLSLCLKNRCNIETNSAISTVDEGSSSSDSGCG